MSTSGVVRQDPSMVAIASDKAVQRHRLVPPQYANKITGLVGAIELVFEHPLPRGSARAG